MRCAPWRLMRVSSNPRANATAFARETLELTQRQYQLGGTGILALLIAQQQYQQERLNLVIAQSLALRRHGGAVPGTRRRLVE